MNKCEKYGFRHSWEDTTPNIVHCTYPATYPNRRRRCVNCGFEQEERVIQREKREWVQINDTQI